MPTGNHDSIWMMKMISTTRDKRWSKAIKERDEYVCRYCGKTGTDAAHIFVRMTCLRYVLENGITLCRVCHQRFDESGDKKFQEKIIEHVVTRKLYNKLSEAHKTQDTSGLTTIL